jgi:hypothetical protein
MIKFYASCILTSLILLAGSAQAQKKKGNFIGESANTIKKVPSQNEVSCAVVSQIPESEPLTFYTFNQTDGYITGTNAYGDKQKANHFDFSGSEYNLLGGVYIYFARANSSDLTKKVTVRVYDATDSLFANELGNTELTMASIRTDVLAGDLTEVAFSPAIELPESKAVFISVDISNLSWSSRPMKDSLVIVSTRFYSIGGTVPYNGAWEQWSDNSWHSFDEDNMFKDSLLLAMLPVACFDDALPVTFSSFSANQFGTANKLVWSTESESGSKGFEVQRSTDGVSFTAIAFVPSQAIGGNSTSTLTYSYIDNEIAPNNNYYRIKQVDLGSKAAFTKTLLLVTDKLKKQGIVQAYPNPVKNNLNLILDLATGKTNTLTVVDLAGKILLQKTVQGTNGNQTTTLNVSNLAKGTYFVKLAGEGDKKLVKFIKE